MANQEQLLQLKAGIEQWNAWRAENLTVAIDLSKADLSEVNLHRCNLAKVNLNGANLSEADLSKADLRGAELHDVDLSRANLRDMLIDDTSQLDLSWRLIHSYINGAYAWTDQTVDEDTLRGADFRGVSFRAADLRKASLRETIFRGVDLRNADLQEANLSNADLREANLSNADLSDSNLQDADLRGANLKRANLSRANLLRAKLLEADVYAGVFTGACLQDWHINCSTKLVKAEADYIYLAFEKGHFSDRRPHSGNFKSGEFEALFQQVIDTIDLIFVDGIDWTAFFTSFKSLRQKYDNADLTIQAIEQKSGGSFLVRLEVSQAVDKNTIEKFLKAEYEQQLQLIETRYQVQLQLKDAELKSHKRESANMLEITKLLANKPITVEANAVADSKSLNQTNYGGTNFQNDISGGEVNQAETINVDRSNITNNMEGASIGNFANQMSDNASQTYSIAQGKSLAEAAQEIQALLDQLSQTYPSETMLQKAKLADAAATQAKANPTLRQRLLSAVDAGTIGAIEELLSHPVATFFIAAVKDWEQTHPNA